jgi:glycosyltransferase involved in cell wall biosynthesis
MRACFIGKYPPIQGGVSARNYWIARWLAESGHHVHVVTNAAEVEPEFRIGFLPEDLAFPGVPADEVWLPSGSRSATLHLSQTVPHGPEARHIPDHNPFVTKLASLAIEAIERDRLDAVIASYFEPYAVAAWVAAKLTGRPLIVRHAGSDVGRLLRHPQLGPCYARILRDAAIVCGSGATLPEFAALGVAETRLRRDPGFAVPREVFHPAAPPANLNALLSLVRSARPHADPRWLQPIDPSLPIVGLYGKFGPAKGTFDLVSALGRLKAAGRRFHLIVLGGGEPRWIDRFHQMVGASGLEDQTRLVPFIAHWRIPAFLRALDVACFLEHDFPIDGHNPGIPEEVLAVGTPLVVTVEVARKQRFAPTLVHGHNVLLVRNPRDHRELSAVLDRVCGDPAAVAAIGRRGHECLPATHSTDIVRRYEQVVADACCSRIVRPLASTTARADARRPAYARELARWQSCQIPDPLKAAQVDELLFRPPCDDGIEHEVASLAPNVDVLTFRYDMEALHRAVTRTGRPTRAWPEQVTHYAVQHLRSPRTRPIRLGVCVHAFLDHLDGRSDVAAVLRRSRGVMDGEELSRAIESIALLFREGILIARQPGAGIPTHTRRRTDAATQRRRPKDHHRRSDHRQQEGHEGSNQTRGREAQRSGAAAARTARARQTDFAHRGKA